MDIPRALKSIRLQLARSKQHPSGSPNHGYQFVAPLDADGHIDPDAWKTHRYQCRVRRFWQGEDDQIGHLVHKPGGAEHARWMFDYDPNRDHDDEFRAIASERTSLHPANMFLSLMNAANQKFRVTLVEPA